MVDVGPSSRAPRVILLRHGPSEDPDPRRWPDDDRRPLTAEGVSAIREAVRALARWIGPVGTLASSPAERARATAEILRGSLASGPELESWPELAPGRPPGPILDRLARALRRGGEVVLVGHNPTLSELVGLALVGEEVALARLTRGGAVCLEFPEALRPTGGRLLWLVTRKQLVAAAPR